MRRRTSRALSLALIAFVLALNPPIVGQALGCHKEYRSGAPMSSSSPATGSVTDTVALVTGAARGIGEAAARKLHAQGTTVVLADVLYDDLERLASEIPPCLPTRLDVSSAEDWTRVVHEVESRFGRLDILVNNAGVMHTGTIEAMSVDAYLAMIMTNQVGPWLGIKAAAPLLRRSGGGAIVNVASIGALGGIAGSSAYCATKAAVRSLTKVAALELAESNIRVNSVLPGAIATAMSTRALAAHAGTPNPFAEQPIPRAGTVDEIAALIAFLATEATYCTGADFVADGGTTVRIGPARPAPPPPP